VAHRGDFLTDKRGRPGQSRALERLRFLRLGRFVDEKILQGARRAPLGRAALAGVDDLRMLLEAVKVHELRAGRARKLLSYRIVRPGTDGAPLARTQFLLAEGCLDAPDLIFSQAGAGVRRG
jgi:hypothetical protein